MAIILLLFFVRMKAKVLDGNRLIKNDFERARIATKSSGEGESF
jgi:hypothetical protein